MMTCLAACSGGFETEPLVEYSTDVVVSGDAPHHLTRDLDAGVYLVEVRERDIDLRVSIDSGGSHTDLADAYLRHGIHRTVLTLTAPTRVGITLNSVDVRTWKGAAALRVLRWPRSASDAAADPRLKGFGLLGSAGEMVARGTPESWRAALEPLRAAEHEFRQGRDPQSLAETEYQRAYIEYALLFDYEAARRSAESAIGDFGTADDEIGAERASLLLALGEFGIAARMSADESRYAQRSLLDVAARRATQAQAFFEAHDLQTDALQALAAAQIRVSVLGHIEDGALAYEAIRRRARARGDSYFEVSATQNLACIAQRKGDLVRAVALYESVLPLVERDRNPELYGGLISNLGFALIALGEFDRALLLHTEALELFSAQGNESQTARELVALAAIQFRRGDLERSLASVTSALPLFERAHDQVGEASAQRLAGNASAELGRHGDALKFLRQAERGDPNGINVDHTRVLIAAELRALGDLNGADDALSRVLATSDQSTRADALTERALLRQRQHRSAEALADLRAADAQYAGLKLDFKRIESSSALALALIESGDLVAAEQAADVAVTMEQRIRVKAANPEMRARFLSASYAPYEARIEVDLATASRDAGAVWRAFRTAEAIRGRALGDRLAQGRRRLETSRDSQAEPLRATLTALQVELEAHTRRGASSSDEVLDLRRRIDETQARLEARLLDREAVRASNAWFIPESQSDTQAALPEDTAVLAYFVGDRRSHAWLLSRTELRHAVLPGRRALGDLVAKFVDRQRSSPGADPDARFAALTGGLLTSVAMRRLLVLPDGPLNGLPFAALPLPRGPARQQLIDKFVLTMAPSLALALRPSESPPDREMRVAVISDPVYTPDDRRLTAAVSNSSRYRGLDKSEGLARLPYSAIEARAVSHAFAGAQVIELAGFDATAQRVAALPAQDLRVLHFATHAVARRDAPEQSALFLSEFAADGTPLATDRLTAEDITHSGLRADVVVLSGCATGDGRELRGEGVLGLTYGFLANGSNAVVASLWPVEDALTARFMEEFYAAYRSSGRAADALRIAQLRTRDTGDSAVWSSFVVRASGFP